MKVTQLLVMKISHLRIYWLNGNKTSVYKCHNYRYNEHFWIISDFEKCFWTQNADERAWYRSLGGAGTSEPGYDVIVHSLSFNLLVQGSNPSKINMYLLINFTFFGCFDLGLFFAFLMGAADRRWARKSSPVYYHRAASPRVPNFGTQRVATSHGPLPRPLTCGRERGTTSVAEALKHRILHQVYQHDVREPLPKRSSHNMTTTSSDPRSQDQQASRRPHSPSPRNRYAQYWKPRAPSWLWPSQLRYSHTPDYSPRNRTKKLLFEK